MTQGQTIWASPPPSDGGERRGRSYQRAIFSKNTPSDQLPNMHFVGFDPGGENAFGWAVLSSVGQNLSLVATGTCTGATNALSAAQAATNIAPIAFGTDAPLFWVQDGDRKADVIVRKMVCAAGGKSGTVSHVNSLRGACLVQGIQVTRLAAGMWPSALITEAHPKALLAVSPSARDVVNRIVPPGCTEHQRDAALAAYAAFALAAQIRDWHDLAAMEQRPFFPGGKNVAYWFPKSQSK